MFWLKRNLPRLVIAPSFGVLAWFVYGFILWTIYISFTKSKLLPQYKFWGIDQYFRLWSMDRWHVAAENLFIFTILFLLLCILIGFVLAILLVNIGFYFSKKFINQKFNEKQITIFKSFFEYTLIFWVVYYVLF